MDRKEELTQKVDVLVPGIKNCKFCGGDHEVRKCPAYGVVCRNCIIRNHFAKMCSRGQGRAVPQRRNVREVVQDHEKVDNLN